MLVFSDTSPISCLASLGRLDLLETYGEVKIVPAVEEELRQHPSERARLLIDNAFSRGLLVRPRCSRRELRSSNSTQQFSGESPNPRAAGVVGSNWQVIPTFRSFWTAPAGAGKSGIGFQPMRWVCSLARMPMPRVFPATQNPFVNENWLNTSSYWREDSGDVMRTQRCSRRRQLS